VEATQDGWWYTAPLCQDRSIVMLMCDADLVREHRFECLEQWLGALDKAPSTRGRLGDLNVQWGPRIFSAVSQRLMRTSNAPAHWLAVGDAALSVDPISGSGVPRALNMAEAASQTITQYLDGDHDAIHRYENDRNAQCTEYLMERASYYGYEQRWQQAPFWKRRVKVLEQAMS